jgi:hypothetical protein
MTEKVTEIRKTFRIEIPVFFIKGSKISATNSNLKPSKKTQESKQQPLLQPKSLAPKYRQ